MYLATLPSSAMNFSSFLVASLGLFMYSITLSANSDSLTSPFPIWILLIYFLIWLLWLGLPILCWIKVARVDFCFVPDFRRNAFHCWLKVKGWKKKQCFSLLSLMLTVGLSHMTFMMLKCVPSIPILLRVKFCQNFFPYLLKLSYDFYSSIC